VHRMRTTLAFMNRFSHRTCAVKMKRALKMSSCEEAKPQLHERTFHGAFISVSPRMNTNMRAAVTESKGRERMIRIGGVLVLILAAVVAFGSYSIALASQRTQSKNDDPVVMKRDENDDEIVAIADDDDDDDFRKALATITNNTAGTDDNTGTGNTGTTVGDGTNTNNTAGTDDNTGTGNTGETNTDDKTGGTNTAGAK
jgi:hypothetical protein